MYHKYFRIFMTVVIVTMIISLSLMTIITLHSNGFSIY